jgi:hypothetical protein
MGLTWQPWTSVSEGVSMPGAPVAAVPWESSFALFIADPGGSIYAIKAVPGYGWELVPGRSTIPGAPVTAMLSGNRFTLFMADVNGEILTTSGIPYQGWAPWTSVSEGSSMPGAPVAAVPWGETFVLFIADPSGGVYAIKAIPGYGWEPVPGRSTKPGASVTAILSGYRITLFMADVNGEIFTTSGVPYQGWEPWTSVSQGGSMPGAPVAAIPWEQTFVLSIADPGGGVYAIKAIPGYGWEPVPGRSTEPGALVTAVSWYEPPRDAEQRCLLFMADVNGAICTTSGIPYQGWDRWTDVSGAVTTPGAPVKAVPHGQGFALFISDSAGGIFQTASSDPPATPTNVHVTSVTADTIDVSWTESNPASVELDGFDLYITRKTNGGEETTRTVPGPTDRTASFTGLDSGVQYSIRIDAFSVNGFSSSSAPVLATTPIAPQTVIVNLTPQGSDNVGVYVPYEATYPPFGLVPAGHVTHITVPSAGVVPRVAFVKRGQSTLNCGKPSAVVIVLAGQTTSAAQMTAIFGVQNPPFSSASPIGFVACVDGGTLPGFIQIELTIVSGG